MLVKSKYKNLICFFTLQKVKKNIYIYIYNKNYNMKFKLLLFN